MEPLWYIFLFVCHICGGGLFLVCCLHREWLWLFSYLLVSAFVIGCLVCCWFLLLLVLFYLCGTSCIYFHTQSIPCTLVLVLCFNSIKFVFALQKKNKDCDWYFSVFYLLQVYWGPPVPFHLTNHTVLLVGCGVHNKTRYWIVRNTWGTNFGDGGHIKIVRGQNCFGIESEIWVPIIDLDTLCFWSMYMLVTPIWWSTNLFPLLD